MEIVCSANAGVEHTRVSSTAFEPPDRSLRPPALLASSIFSIFQEYDLSQLIGSNGELVWRVFLIGRRRWHLIYSNCCFDYCGGNF